MAELQRFLKQVAEEHISLSRAEARRTLDAMLEAVEGDTSADLQIAAMLASLATRGETAEELTGFSEAMRARAQTIPLTGDERASLVDTCGTGGDGRGTFNISTGAALVAAAAGAKVAKHGNRGVTSRCGSADVLEALGVPVVLSPDQAASCLRVTGFSFLYAPLLHPSMKRVQTVRRALGFRTIFNLAGPLTNPAAAQAQVMGVFASKKLPLVAEAMAKLGVRHAFVVHGCDGLDELTLTGESEVAEIRERTIRLFRLEPESAGLERASLETVQGGETAAGNASILEEIFAGEKGPRRDIVLLNAAAALVAAGLAADFRDGVARGAGAIDSGTVLTTLNQLRQFGKTLAAPSS
jgi:anthranilate phosphoribosyltransferase